MHFQSSEYFHFFDADCSSVDDFVHLYNNISRFRIIIFLSYKFFVNGIKI